MIRIHWFDLLVASHASSGHYSSRLEKTRAIKQTMKPPLLAQSLIEFEGGQASQCSMHLYLAARTIGRVRRWHAGQHFFQPAEL